MTAPEVQAVLRPATTEDLMQALEAHYRKPGAVRDGEILLREVQAPGSDRRADLVRIGLWASRGAGIDVHEVKATRADWLRELDDPAKADSWWLYCHRFWVAAPPGIVQHGELPEGWGLMELPPTGRRRWRIIVQAVTRDARLTVPLIIELLRRLDNQRLAEMERMSRDHMVEMDRREAAWRAEAAVTQLPTAVQDRLDALKVIEGALGMQIDRWGGWPKLPVRDIAPAELAAFLADTVAHVTVQRRATVVNDQRAALRRAAQAVLDRTGDTGGTQ